MKMSSRVEKLPPYLFADLDKRIKSKREEGADIIHFGIGDPDLPTPDHIIDACCKAAKDPENHRYPSYQGMLSFREAVTERYKRDRKVEPTPHSLYYNPIWYQRPTEKSACLRVGVTGSVGLPQ